MMVSVSPQSTESLDYGFLVLVYSICADQQIHNRELRALQELADRMHLNAATRQEMGKILGQDDAISLEDAIQKVSIGQRSEVLRQAIAIACIDGYLSPAEREMANQMAQAWGFHGSEIEQMLEAASGWQQSQIATNQEDDFLRNAERLDAEVISRSLARLAGSAAAGEQQTEPQREVLLSGPAYGEVIQQCAQIASEDFQCADRAFRLTFTTLSVLRNGLQQEIHQIQQKTVGLGRHDAAREVADQLEQTRKTLSAEILHNLKAVCETLQAKKRALNNFSVAFMGRTKAGKSTLHAVMTGEGWEAIGIGKQRTTRYNRVYEWNNIRMIDTPGIGAPGGKTDEEIALSIIDEADVICYVVTDDSIQETEFAFLKLLKEKTKPLIILLNIHCNLREPRRLEHFLKNPDRLFALEGRNSIAGHLERIHRYAKEHYANDYLTVIPVMLLAAQLSREPAHRDYANSLFQASRLQDFLDSLQLSLIHYGKIRRSQTLLGSSVGSINTPYTWVAQQASAYEDLVRQLRTKRQTLKQQLDVAKQGSLKQLQQQIKIVFHAAYDQVTSFAETHWEANEQQMKSGWENKLKSLAFQEQLKAAPEMASQHFQQDVREAIAEIGKEFQLISQLHSNSFTFAPQASSLPDRDFVRISGMVLMAAGTLLTFAFPPLGLLGVVGGVVGGVTSWLSGQFKSRDQKRHEAVEAISLSLKRQLDEQQNKTLQQLEANFETYCQSIATAIDHYFEELIQGLEAITAQLTFAQGGLSKVMNYLNRAYAKRIVDWAIDQYEPLTEVAINQRIVNVDRIFGRSLHIQTSTTLPVTKTPDEICKILQEDISIQSTKP